MCSVLADTDSELSEINVVCCIGTVEIQIYKSKYKKVGVLPIWIVKFNVSSVGRSSERNRK